MDLIQLIHSLSNVKRYVYDCEKEHMETLGVILQFFELYKTHGKIGCDSAIP